MTQEREKVLVVGFGLAGTVLSHQLENFGCQVYIADKLPEISSSKVAAGIFNPVLVGWQKPVWLANEIFSHFPDFYKNLELKLNKTFFHPTPLTHFCENHEELNNWDSQLSNEDYAKWFSNSNKNLPDYIIPSELQVQIHGAGWLDIPSFVKYSKTYFESKGRWIDEKINFTEDLIEKDGIWYVKNLPKGFDKVFFCKGEFERNENEPFSFLPFKPVKGDVIDIKIKGKLEPTIYHKKVFLLPISDSVARVGSTYNWDILDYEPDAESSLQLQRKLKEFLNTDFEIVDHKSGIRPATAGRRPYIGPHPKYQNLFVMNGLGSKGVTLAPYISEILIHHIFKNQNIPTEISTTHVFKRWANN